MLARLKDLLYPLSILVIVATVWTVAWAQDIDQKSQRARFVPPPASLTPLPDHQTASAD